MMHRLADIDEWIGQTLRRSSSSQAGGFDIITKSDLIYFLTRQNGDNRH